MPSLQNGNANGESQPAGGVSANATRFSDIPAAIDIPVSGLDTEEAVEVNLEDHLDDPTELCQLLENEKAAKHLWITIALAYAKQSQLDHAIEILNKGLGSLSRSGPKERLSLFGCVAWLDLLKSRHAPRTVLDAELASEMRTKDHYLREATSTINDALRINPAFPPLLLTRGVLFLLKASLQASGRVGTSASEAERIENLKNAQRCFDDASRSSAGRNMMAVMGRARTQYLLGRYGEALQSYQIVLAKMPVMKDPDPRIGVGCCLWKLGYQDRAKMAWERSLTLNPASKAAHALLGIFYLHEAAKYPASDPQFNALYKKAMIEHTKKAYTIDKDFPLSCATFASYFLLTGRYDTVEPLARKAIEQTDTNAIASDGWYLLARKEHNRGELTKAMDYYNRADQARGGGEKGYWPAKFGMIQITVQLQNFEDAKFRLEKMQHPSKNLESTTLLGCLYAEEVFAGQLSLGKEDKAVEAKKAITMLEHVRKSWKDERAKTKPDESVLLYLARLYEVENPVESMRCLQQVESMQLEKIPDEDRPNPGEDEATYSSQLRENLPPQLLNNMACFLFGSESFELARETFQIALNACVKLTERQDAEKRAAEDEDNIDTNDLETKDTDALVTTISYNLARTYESLGMLNEAHKVYEGLLARHADYTDASARLAYMALRASPQDDGPRKVQALYQSDYGNTEVRALMGWYHGRSKKKTMNIAEDQEHRHYKHTLQGYDKHDRYALTGMGNVQLMIARDMPRYTEAEREKRSRMYQKAVEFFDKALQLDPKNAYAAQGIAIAMCDDKRQFSDAVQHFTKIRDTIRDASVFSNLGHVYAELRQYQKSIENYEIALKKDGKGENPLLLACLSRSWLLKGKNDKSIPALNTSLQYMQRALAAQPDSVHLQFNIAFLQFQIAQLVNSIADAERTLEDVQAASSGLEDAIITFGEVAKVKQPPYPRSALEQRAAMAKNTMRKQLERAERSQREYEEKNAEKLKDAREKREEELRKRETARLRRRQEEEAKSRAMNEQRQKMIEDTEKMAEKLRAEQVVREAAEYTDDEESGIRVKRKGKGGRREGGTKKGKKRERDLEDEGFIEDDDVGDDEGLFDERSARSDTRSPAVESGEDGEERSRPREKPKRKKRRLERKGGNAGGLLKKPNKYKSEAVVVDSDSDGEGPGMASEAPTPVENGRSEDEEMRDQLDDEDDEDVPRTRPARPRKQLRTIADEDDDDDDDEDGGAELNGTAGGLDNEADERETGNIDLARAALAAGVPGIAEDDE